MVKLVAGASPRPGAIAPKALRCANVGTVATAALTVMDKAAVVLPTEFVAVTV
jgi:hypothetical protein